MENLKIKHYFFNAFVIQNDKVKIAIDPGKNLFWTKLNSLIPKSEWKGVTHVLVTHGDPDHFVYAIPMAKETGAKVVCGEGLEEDFLSNEIEDVHKIDVGAIVRFENLNVEGLNAKHGSLPVKLLAGLIDIKNEIARVPMVERKSSWGLSRLLKAYKTCNYTAAGSLNSFLD